MNISLTPELEAIVHEKVKTGLYHSASEVIRQALRLLQEQEQLRQIRLDDLRKEIAKGLASLERGEGRPLDLEALKAEGRARLGRRK
jgi:antitoxin ParD1/3/4